MFVTMNRFTIHPQYWDAFEARFEERARLIDREPGFIRNAVLRPAEKSSEQHIVMTIWESREAFEAWTQSEAFRIAHQRAGQTPREWFAKPTQLEMFDAISDSSS